MPMLQRLSTDEQATVLEALLSAHPDLRTEAEAEAQRTLESASVDGISVAVELELSQIPLEALASRAGRIPGRGYVHETEAAWELVNEAIQPFRTDLHRRAELGLLDAAARIAAAIVAGLHRVRNPEMGSVLAYAGDDCPDDLANEILEEAEQLGLPILDGALDEPVQHWLDLG